MLPLKREGYDLSSTEFRDQLAIRYGRQPLALPAQCDGCGKPFSLQHGLDCPKGGLIKRGHNDLRDSDAKLADMAFGGVVVEPIMVPEGDRTGQPALRADWLARGVWEDNRVAFLIIASLMPTHPVTPIHPGKLLPTALLTRRKRSIVRPPRTSVGRSHHWFVPRMGCYIANTPAIRSDLLVASPSSGTSHFLSSWLGCEFAANLQ